MKKLKLFFACLLMAVLSIGQVWGQAAAGTTLFSENFGSYSANDVPSGTVTTGTGRVVYGDANVTYTCTNGTGTKPGTTKIYSEALAGGTSPELMVGKKGTGTGALGGSFSIAGIPSGDAQEITVSYKQNAQNLSVSVAGTGYTGSISGKPSAAGERTFDVTVDDGADATFTLTFQAAATSNVRVDDILVTVKTAGEGGGPAPTLTGVTVSGTPTKTSYESGENFDPAGLTVTGTYSDASSGLITSGITWAYNPSQTLAANQTSIGVTATVGEITSAEFTVNGLSVAAGPDVTLDLIDGNWGFPTSDTKTLIEYTNSETSYAVSCYATTAYKVNGSNYFIIGKSGSYIVLPEFANPVEKIVVVGNSAGSGSVVFNIFDGDEAASTAVTGCTSDKTFEIEDPTANKQYTLKVTSAHNLQLKKIKIYFGAAPAVAKPTISGDENFVTSTTVTISHADADHIYYTTNGVDPTTSSTEYLAPFTVDADGTTTVKAIAVKGSDVSDPATKTFTKVEALESLAALLEATTSTETAFNVVISNWVVTGVQGTRAWIADAANEKGILLYKSGHNFVAGNKLNGVVIGTKTKLYQGYPEMTTLVSTDVTVTTAEAITPRVTTIAALTSGHPAEQGTVVKLENVTYSSSVLSDGVNSIAADNKLFSSLALVDGTTYDITGVVEYLDGSVVKIMPRSAADVEAQTPVVTPTAANLAALKAAARGTYILTLENAVVTYVNGKNAFIEDATGGALIFIQDHGFTAGDCLNGDYQVVTTDYQGKFEITAIEPQAGAATTTAAIPLTTVSIATLNASFSSYESRRVKIVGANVTDAIKNSDRNGAINDGAALAVYAAVASTITLNADDNVDIIGYPGFHNTDQQLNVWRQEDITVNVKEDPELAYNPAVVNVLLSDLASFTPADLEYATGFDGLAAITYESSDPSIATVETDGTVTLVATEEGSTTITASFPGNATYKVDNASYTINVSATPITPVYTMSFDMTRASYDAAADAQVVWNSSVVTMTADKNDGTKVTNFLAGNYSGTTLIEETRFYAKNSISFVPQAGVTITKIEWMSTAKGYATKLAAETFVNATAVVDGTDDKLVIITPSAAGEISVTLTDAARATAVTVYYEAESEKAKLDASISIANINTAVGEEDILLSSIAATSNPNKNAISYAIESGSEYVSIVGEGKAAAFHAIAEGTATISATIPNDLGNYTGATTTFNIVVAAAPATLESIAISGDASVLEYTAGQHFNPAGLVVTGTYSDASSAPITEGIDWTFAPDPLTEGTTSVSVTATVGEISSAAVVVNGLTVAAAPAPVADNVVILATYGTKLYAMSTTLSSNAFTAIEVEEDGSNIVVPNADAKAAIQWTRTTTGENTTFQDADSKYMAGGTGNTNMSLADDPFNWSWNATDSYYYIGTTRSFFYYKSGVFKNYSINNAGGDDYSGFAEVRAIDPANIVISSKVDPEIAYDPATLTITQGDTWTAPTLVNPNSVTITSYASNNEAVATVTNEGVIALAGGTGTATITAHFDGDASYLEADATYEITVNAPAPTPTSTTYTKVTATGDLTDGEYLIVYETTSVAFDGSLETLDAEGNSVAVVINEGVIAGTTAIDAATFTINVTAGTLQSASGHYIGVSSNSNGLKQTDEAATYTHTFSIDGDGNAVIFANFESSTMKLRYNPSTSAGNLRFRYYKNDGQQAIQLYKKDAPEPPTPVYTEVRGGLTAGNYYTICYPKSMTDVQGATLWSFVGKDTEFAYIEQETATTIEAGKPYILYATATTVTAILGTEDAAAGTNGAIHGTFSDLTQDQLNTYATVAGNDLYLVIGNQLRRATGTGTGSNTLPAQRAYVIVDEITGGKPSPAPGKKVRSMPMQKDQAQGFENIEASEKPMKVMIDGTLYILRGEKVYDATGRLVK